MALSGSVDFTITRDNIIEDAMLLIGALESGESPSTDETTDLARLLNMMVKHWQVHDNLWRLTEHAIPLYDNKQSYTIGVNGNKSVNRPLHIEHARRVDSNGNETAIDLVSMEEYYDLSLKSSTGIITEVYYDPQLTQGKLFVWPVASTSSTSLSDGSTDLWTDSPATPGEYYYTGTAISAEPTYVFADGTELTEGTIGSLANDEYAWGDQDSLGTDTLYVKVSEGDPDGQASGFIKVLTSTPDVLKIVVQDPLQDFDASGDNPHYPSEWGLALVYNLAVLAAPQFDVQPDGRLIQQAAQLKAELLAHDEEETSIFLQPKG